MNTSGRPEGRKEGREEEWKRKGGKEERDEGEHRYEILHFYFINKQVHNLVLFNIDQTVETQLFNCLVM